MFQCWCWKISLRIYSFIKMWICYHCGLFISFSPVQNLNIVLWSYISMNIDDLYIFWNLLQFVSSNSGSFYYMSLLLLRLQLPRIFALFEATVKIFVSLISFPECHLDIEELLIFLNKLFLIQLILRKMFSNCKIKNHSSIYLDIACPKLRYFNRLITGFWE